MSLWDEFSCGRGSSGLQGTRLGVELLGDMATTADLLRNHEAVFQS